MDFYEKILTDAIDYLDEGNDEAIKILSKCVLSLSEDQSSSFAEGILVEIKCSRAEYDILSNDAHPVTKAILHAFYVASDAPSVELKVKFASKIENPTKQPSDERKQETQRDDFPLDIEPFMATLARLFATKGDAREVAILASAKAKVIKTEYDNWNGGTQYYALFLEIPVALYSQITDEREGCEERILAQVQIFLRPYPDRGLAGVSIIPLIKADEKWREKAQNWVSGKGITNQGRVRSDNIASKECDGLLFRSTEEIHLYKALKALGISFAPLPVFLRGGETYKRIEPDFVILKEGIILVVEVDGDTVHQETPAEAHARTTMLVHEGAHVERVKGSDCRTPELAAQCAANIVKAIEKLKATR